MLPPDATPESLGIEPGLTFDLDRVPLAVQFMAPWAEDVAQALSVAQQCELATEGAVIVPVLHWGWPERIRVLHPHTLLATIRRDRPACLQGVHTHNALLVLRETPSTSQWEREVR